MKALPPHTKHTYIYKIHDTTPIELDVYRSLIPSDTGNENKGLESRTILLYFHGGYLVGSPQPSTLNSFQPGTSKFVLRLLKSDTSSFYIGHWHT